MTLLTTIGAFEDHLDIGPVRVPGDASFDGERYTVSGSGYNMWFDRDEFHFLWRRVEGDIALEAVVEFPALGVDAHRKACLVIRQDLEPDSVYADFALHGDGLASLQYRAEQGALTREVQSNRSSSRIGIVRRGDTVTALVDGKPSGGSVRLPLTGAYYIGLAVCSHDVDVAETAIFSDVHIGSPDSSGTTLYSTLEIVDIASTDRRTVEVFDRWIEAPNWTADDRLIYNSEGLLYSMAAAGGEEKRIDTGFATRCNNDHGLSPDGTLIAISDQSQDDGGSVIYTVPIDGGEPKRITAHAPSYWHGWSPDGSTLAYCAERDGVYGIFVIPADGGEETRLTTARHLDDGPDYSPDGAWIYFNSDRTGRMQIWRVPAAGGEPERVLETETADWFPHISPDGRWMTYIAYDGDVEGHPRDHDVTLQLVDLTDGSTRLLAELFGGQGTMNVPSWSPDSSRLAFVSYAYL
jgi:Tol biopolymer transport system component